MQSKLNVIVSTLMRTRFRISVAGFIRPLLFPRGVIAVIPAYSQQWKRAMSKGIWALGD